jgi:molecular chaperone GrpE
MQNEEIKGEQAEIDAAHTPAAEPELPQEPDAEALLAAERDKYLRLLADYDNYRRRSVREREMIYADAKADAVSKLLPVHDDLERAANAECSDEKYAQGVVMTLSKLAGILDSLGVVSFGEAGEAFDANRHNAVSSVDSAEHESGTLAQVYEKGFMLGDKIIRHAIVSVAN